MAERRMFAKTIVTSDEFLDMPTSTRCLYFTLGMFADDDGFVNNPKSIIRQIGASVDDMNILIAKKFVLVFDSGVIVIKHWRIHNYIQKDRYKESKYIEEKSNLRIDEKGAYTFGEGVSLSAEKARKPLTDAQQKRFDAKAESDLPYSFEYKIRKAFHRQLCPICNCLMDENNNLTKPTIQHNIPISLGGKHEIDNISVICASCNCSIQNRRETPPYNTEKVKQIWSIIENVSGMDTQVRLGKVSIIEEKKEIKKRTTASVDTPKKKYGTYSHILLTETQYKKLVADFGEQYANACINGVDEYIQMKGAKYKDHNLVIRKAIREGWSCIPERAKEQVKTAREIAGDKAQEEWKEKELLLSNPRYAELDKRVRQLTLASVNGENVAEELLACKDEMSRLRNKILKGEV